MRRTYILYFDRQSLIERSLLGGHSKRRSTNRCPQITCLSNPPGNPSKYDTIRPERQAYISYIRTIVLKGRALESTSWRVLVGTPGSSWVSSSL